MSTQPALPDALLVAELAAPLAAQLAAELAAELAAVSGNCLQFPESPAKFRENLTEKTAISVDLQQNFEKSCKNYENVQKSENFEM